MFLKLDLLLNENTQVGCCGNKTSIIQSLKINPKWHILEIILDQVILVPNIIQIELFPLGNR
jgi:hypothetical protein